MNDYNTNNEDKKSDLSTKLKTLLINLMKKKAVGDIIKILNTVTTGKFSEAVLKTYKESELESKDSDELVQIANTIMTKFPEVAKAEKQEEQEKKLDSREDENTSTDIDEKSISFDCLFAGDAGKQILSVINKIQEDNEKNLDFIKKQDSKAKQEMKKNGLKLDGKEQDTLAPAVAGLVAQGKTGKQLKTEIDKIKKEIDESYNRKINDIYTNNIINENKIILTEDVAKQLYCESAFVCEGFLDAALGIFGKDKTSIENFTKIGEVPITSDKLGKRVMSSYAEYGYTIKNTEYTTAPIGWAKMAAAWAPILLSAAIALTYKYRKQIRNILESQYGKFKNKKGVIASMGFKTVGNDTLYELQFSIKDFKWRCLNKKNILHYPSKELIEASLKSKLGKRFRDWCSKTWTPIFGKEGDKSTPPFVVLINAKTDGKIEMISDKTLKMCVDFANNWDRIQKDCLSDDFKYDIRPR